MTYRLFEKLKDPEYRKAFVASQINVGIPFQIRGLLKSRPGWTQTTLAEEADMRQPSISGLLTPGKTRPNIETLRRIAEAFDCGLMVRFVSFSDLARWSEEFDPDSFYVPSFKDDVGFVQHKPMASEAGSAAPQVAQTGTASIQWAPLIAAGQGASNVGTATNMTPVSGAQSGLAGMAG